jgi:hypothetical protein
LSSGQIGAKIAQSTPGDLAMEIAKTGAAVASVQGLIGGLIGLLQQLQINGTEGVPTLLQKKKTPSSPASTPEPSASEDPEAWEGKKFPKVTIRY